MPAITDDLPAPSGPRSTIHSPRRAALTLRLRAKNGNTKLARRTLPFAGLALATRSWKLETPLSVMPIDHHTYGHLQRRRHALIGPVLGPAHRDENDVPILQLGVGRLVRQDLVQRQFNLRALARRVSNQHPIRLRWPVHPPRPRPRLHNRYARHNHDIAARLAHIADDVHDARPQSDNSVAGLHFDVVLQRATVLSCQIHGDRVPRRSPVGYADHLRR